MQNAFVKALKKKIKSKIKHHEHLKVSVLAPDMMFYPYSSVFIDNMRDERSIICVDLRDNMRLHITYTTKLARRSRIYDLKDPKCVEKVITFIVRTIEKYHV